MCLKSLYRQQHILKAGIHSVNEIIDLSNFFRTAVMCYVVECYEKRCICNWMYLIILIDYSGWREKMTLSERHDVNG